MSRPRSTTLLLPGLAVLAALLAGPVWAGWLTGGRGGLIVLILSLILLATLAWNLAVAFGDNSCWDVRAIDAATIALAILVVLGLVLGTIGILYLPVMLLALGGIGLLAFWWTGRQSDPPSVSDGPGWSLADVRWPHAVLAGLAVFGLGQLARDRGLLPSVGDAIAYHLPFVAEWLQHGRLVMPVPAAGDPAPPFYPLNSSLWTFWTVAPFESDVLARFVQAPFYMLLFLSVTRLALEIRIPLAGALTAGLLTLTLPDVIRRISMAENDVILAALLVTATSGLALLWHRPSAWRACMVAALLGMAAGTKVLAMPSVAVLGAVWMGIVVYHWRSLSRRTVMRLILIGAGLVILLGGYSYIRNAVVMGNPSYPVRIELQGEEIFPGLYTADREWRESHPFYSFDWSGFFGFGMRNVFGWTLPLFILPGLVLAVVRGLLSRQILPVVLLAWCCLSLAIFWFVIPFHFERFLFATLAWGIIVAVWGWLALLPGREWMLAVAAIPLALVNVSSLPINTDVWNDVSYVAPAVLVTGGTAAGVLAIRRFRHMLSPAMSAAALAGLLVLTIVVWPLYAGRYEEQRFDQWGRLSSFLGSQPEAWRWLWDETRDDPATVAVAGTNSTYPLYGPTLENQVLTISRDGRLHEYGWGMPFRPFGEPNREQWLRAVREAGVDYLWVTANVSFGGWPVQDTWAAAEGFEPVIHEDDLHVWRIPQR